MEYSRRCDICNIDVHRASMIKRLRKKKPVREYKTR